MAKQSKNEKLQMAFFSWILTKRDDVFCADGRSNTPPVGRHSLGTKSRSEALEQLRSLDRTMAVKHGRADPSLLRRTQGGDSIPLAGGIERFMAVCQRALSLGGVTERTAKRYSAVLKKFRDYSEAQGINLWDQVTTELVSRYSNHLVGKDYQGKTITFEIGLIKQVNRWLILERLLPQTMAIQLRIPKRPTERTYCYSDAQISAMIAHCQASAEIQWLGNIVLALAHAGLRISELAALRWDDINLQKGSITLTDNLALARLSERNQARTTKSHYSRTLPIHEELEPTLRRLEGQRRTDGLVFHGPRHGKVKPDTIRNILKREVLQPLKNRFPKTGFERSFEDGRLHSFRHFFCSNCAKRGVPERTLMAWLGHRSSDMIRIYYHNDLEHSRAQMAKLPSLSQAVANEAIASNVTDLGPSGPMKAKVG